MYWLPRSTAPTQPLDQLYVGLRRHGEWNAYPVQDVTDADLADVDVHVDLHASLLDGGLSREEAAEVIERHAAVGLDPHVALHLGGHECEGLARVRARLFGMQGGLSRVDVPPVHAAGA